MYTVVLTQFQEIISTESKITLKNRKEKLEKSNNLSIFLTYISNAIDKLLITVKKGGQTKFHLDKMSPY